MVLVIPFCYFVTAGLQWDGAALVVFILAACTDWFDGYYARRYKAYSDAGALLDPLADKLLVATALIAFAQDRVINLPVWSVVLILGREFLITGLRGLLAQSRIIMGAASLGKAKTVAQMAAIVVFLVARRPNDQSFLIIGYAIYYLAVVLAVLSAFEYLWIHRDFIEASFKKKSTTL